MPRTIRFRFLVVAAALFAAAVFLPAVARLGATYYHDDSLWANSLASLGGSQWSGDFGYVFLPAADDVLGGRNPYMDPDDFTGPPQAPYAYPPALALAITPLAALPETVTGTHLPVVLFSLLLVAAVFGALLLLDVRDWRCYPVAFLYPVTLEAVEYGAVGPLLLLLVAVAWRFRDRVLPAGSAVGVAVVIKLFLWPLILWFAFSRRLRAAALAAAVAFALALMSWLAIGLDGIGEYPRLLRKLVDVEAANSYSTFAMFRTIGLSEPVAKALVAGVGVALLATAAWATRAPDCSARERDRRSLTLVLAAALVLTPILWLHYLVLLIAPIALARPRLSLLWFAPLTLTVFEALDWYRGWPSGDGRALASVALVVTVVFVVSARSRESTSDAPRGVPARAV